MLLLDRNFKEEILQIHFEKLPFKLTLDRDAGKFQFCQNWAITQNSVHQGEDYQVPKLPLISVYLCASIDVSDPLKIPPAFSALLR